MFCKNCGKEIDDNAYVCPYCGVRTETTSVTGQSATNGFAIAGIIISVASWVIYIILYVTVFAAMFAGIASGAGL